MSDEMTPTHCPSSMKNNRPSLLAEREVTTLLRRASV
jgi:hypothetical protein